MKITDENDIKNGEKELIDTIIGELDWSAIEKIFNLKEQFPKLNATQIYFRLVENGFIPTSVSVAAVQRFIKKQGMEVGESLVTGKTVCRIDIYCPGEVGGISI